MKKNQIAIGIGIAILFQFLVLTGEYLNAAIPLWNGKEIRIKTIPVDPRSMFRGNYARLRYDISRVKTDELPENEDLRNGERVYVRLRPSAGGLYTFNGVSLIKPKDGIFLRGRIANRQYEKKVHYFRIKYGIEAYFAPRKKAIALEKQLTKGAIAVLMVTEGGKAALKGILPPK